MVRCQTCQVKYRDRADARRGRLPGWVQILATVRPAMRSADSGGGPAGALNSTGSGG